MSLGYEGLQQVPMGYQPIGYSPLGLGGSSDGLIFDMPLLDSLAGLSEGPATYTRASDASYVDGLVKYVTGGRVNRTTDPQELGSAAWTVSTASVTSNAAAAPDGSNSADLLDLSSPGSSVFQNIGFGLDEDVACSFYLQKSSGSGSIEVRSTTGPTFGQYIIDIDQLSVGQWVRIKDGNSPGVTSFTPFVQNGGGGGFQIGNFVGAVTPTVYVWGVQYEEVDIAAAGASGYVAEVRNKLLWSQEFDNGVWAQSGTGTVTPNAATAPDGTPTAYNLDDTSAASVLILLQNVAIAATTGAQTYSLWMRTDNPHQVVLGFQLNGGSGQVNNLIVSVTEEWQRFSGTITNDGTNNNAAIRVFATLNSNPEIEQVYAWGAQLEPGSTPTGYVATTTAQVIVIPDEPRFESGVVNEGRVNEAQRSEEFEQSPWAHTRVVATDNVTANPVNGDQTASQMAEDTDPSTHAFEQAGMTLDATSTYILSVYAKPISRDWFELRLSVDGDSTNFQAFFDVANGVVGETTGQINGTFITATVEPAGSGWYRCSLVGVLGSAPTTGRIRIFSADADGNISFTGNGLPSHYFYGAQLEVAANNTALYPSAYTATTTVAVATPGINLPDAPRTVSTNGWLHSEDFDNAAWSKTRVTVTANAATAPDGTGSADRVVPNTDNDNHTVEQLAPDTTDSTNQTITVHGKADELRWCYILTRTKSGGIARTFFDVQDGVIGTTAGSHTSSIQAAGNGWYRCRVTYDIGAGGTPNPGCGIGPADSDGGNAFAGNNVDGLYVWGAQFEIDASTAGPYTRTFATARTFSYADNPAPQGYLSEGARTNLCLESEDFDPLGPWGLTRLTLSLDAEVAPDGNATGERATSDASAATTHNQTQPITVTANADLTVSLFAKKGVLDWIVIGLVNNGTGSDGFRAWFDLANGEVGTSETFGVGSTLIGSSIELMPNGWFRCQVSGTLAAAITTGRYQYWLAEQDAVDTLLAPTGTEDLFVWGAQLEEAAFVSSYIPTGAAAVARAADALSYPLVGPPQGTALATADREGLGFNSTVFQMDDGTTDNRTGVTATSQNRPDYTVRVGGVIQADIVLGGGVDDFDVNVSKDVAGTFAPDSFEFYTSGVSRGTDSLGTVPTTSVLNVGSGIAGGSNLHGHVHSVKIYNRVLGAGEV